MNVVRNIHFQLSHTKSIAKDCFEKLNKVYG